MTKLICLMINKINPEESAEQVKKAEGAAVEETQKVINDFESVKKAAEETIREQPADSTQAIGQVPVPGTGAGKGKGSGSGTTVKK